MIDLTDIVREEPALCEWDAVDAALDTALLTKTLKPAYKERLSPVAGGTRLLHRLLVTDRMLVPMFPHCAHLRSIDLSFCENVGDRTLIELAEHCSKVERVIVTRCLKITGLGVNALLSRLKNLRELNCGWCPDVDDEIVEVDDEFERALALESVQLSWTKVSLAGVFTLVQQCRQLRVLGYGFGRSPLFDTLVTSRDVRKADPPIEDTYDSKGRRTDVDQPIFPGCLPCRSPYCENVESAPFEYGVCAGCKSAMYCSKACQGVAWHFGHGRICNVRNHPPTQLKYQPYVAEGIVKCAGLRVLDASGNRALADVVLGCLLVHQERFLLGQNRKRRQRRESRRKRRDDVERDEAHESGGGGGGGGGDDDEDSATSASTAVLAAATAASRKAKNEDDSASSSASANHSANDSDSDDIDSELNSDEDSETSMSGSTKKTGPLRVEADNDGQDVMASDGRHSLSFDTARTAARWLSTMAAEPNEPVSLRCLCVSKCVMTDDRIRALAPVLLNLTHLDLEKNCLTDVGVSWLATYGRNLRHLQITGARLTLSTATLLCTSAFLRTSLRSLLVGGTGAMGVREARHVIESCENLKRLYVWSQMTEDEGEEIQQWLDSRYVGRGLLVLAKARLTDIDPV